MAYTKQTWTTGDTVTSTKLNHMEDGIEAAASSSLPSTIPSTDNGKVLYVDSSGHYVLEKMSLAVTATDEGETIKLDSAYDAIHNAIYQGKNVFIKEQVTYDGNTVYMLSPVVGFYAKSGGGKCGVFVHDFTDSGALREFTASAQNKYLVYTKDTNY